MSAYILSPFVQGNPASRRPLVEIGNNKKFSSSEILASSTPMKISNSFTTIKSGANCLVAVLSADFDTTSVASSCFNGRTESDAKSVASSCFNGRTESYISAVGSAPIEIRSSDALINSASRRNSMLEKLKHVRSSSVDSETSDIDEETLGSRTASICSTISIQSLAESPAAQRKSKPVLAAAKASSKQDVTISFCATSLAEESTLSICATSVVDDSMLSRDCSSDSEFNSCIDSFNESIVANSKSLVNQESERPSVFRRITSFFSRPFISLFSRRAEETPEQRVISAAVRKFSEFALQVNNIDCHLMKAQGNALNTKEFSDLLLAARKALALPDQLSISVDGKQYTVSNFALQHAGLLDKRRLSEKAISFSEAIDNFKKELQKKVTKENNAYLLLDRLLSIK